MSQTIRPNVRFRDVQRNQSGMASPAAVDGLAVALTLCAVAVVIGAVVLLEHLSEFWAGFVSGGIAGVSLMIGLIAVGVCLAGGSSLETPRPGTCDRGMPR